MQFEKREPTEKDIAFAKKAQDDMQWLNKICERPPDMADLEKVVNTLGILQNVNPYMKNMTTDDRLVLGLVGHIVKVAQENNKKRFAKISAWAYIQLAYSWFTEGTETTQDDYVNFVQRISGG